MEQQVKHLLSIREENGVRTILLHHTNYSIGRDKQNDIVLFSKTVSRCHARLTRSLGIGSTDYNYRILDGDGTGKFSTNGISVNDQRCREHPLSSGDTIVIGNVHASYRIEQDIADQGQNIQDVDLQHVEDLAPLLNPKATMIEDAAKLNPQNINQEDWPEDDLPPTTLFRK